MTAANDPDARGPDRCGLVAVIGGLIFAIVVLRVLRRGKT